MPIKGVSDALSSALTTMPSTRHSSTVVGNITPDDVKSLPINDRNYMELATLVPGVRVNAITNDTPLGGENSGKSQINLDGLQVTRKHLEILESNFVHIFSKESCTWLSPDVIF